MWTCGASEFGGTGWPRMARRLTRTMSPMTTQRIADSNTASTASRRWLKISWGATAACSGGIVPEASLAAIWSAAARNPMRGSLETTFCQVAVVVTIASHASGTAVTQL